MFILICPLLAPTPALPFSDAGIVTQAKGEMSGVSANGNAFAVEAFMKVRDGDRLSVPGGGAVQIVFFANGRKETWKGPAEVLIGTGGGRSGKGGLGNPEVAKLPFEVAGEMVRVGVLVEASRRQRIGGVVVRGEASENDADPMPPIPLSPEEEQTIAKARTAYEALRSSAADSDITPELYLFSVLADYDQFREMKTLIEKMQRKQPENEEIALLSAWLKNQM